MATLAQALQHARVNRLAAEDWCIIRLDGQDRTMEVYWSEPNAPYRSTSATQNGPGGQTREWGGHAEMQLIRDFPHVIANRGVPVAVEVFLSRSPCARSPMFTANGLLWPEGCGKKLVRLAREYYGVNWTIQYDAVFAGAGGDPVALAGAQQMIHLLNQEGNVNTRLRGGGDP